MKTLILIPAYNEEKGLRKILKDLKQLNIGDILVIDDGSEDKTFETAKKENVKVIRHLINLGVPCAYQTGFLYALKYGYDCVITMDADGQHIPNEIKKLLDEFSKTKADIIIGAYPQRANIFKKIVWKIWRKLTGLKIKDFTSGFRLYSKKAYTFLANYPMFAFEYQDIELLLTLKRKNFKIKEISVKMNKRIEGKSKLFTNLYDIIRYLIVSIVSIFISKKEKKNVF